MGPRDKLAAAERRPSRRAPAPRGLRLSGMRARRLFGPVLVLALSLVLAFLALPVVAIFVNVPPGRLLARLGDAQAVDALRLSLETSTIALAVVVVLGTPAAYLLARGRVPGRAVLVTLVELPLVLPPAVAGIGLLAALGPHGILGGALRATDVRLVLQTSGVVVALTFVASPFYLRQAQAAFAAVPQSQLDASRTLGATAGATFLRVAIPVALPGLTAGLALAWARALGEFGATLMFAGSYRGVTQTAPLAIYEQFSTDFTGALALAAILVVVSASLLMAVKLLAGPLGAGRAAR
jgi:molybdate transport system permease protein